MARIAFFAGLFVALGALLVHQGHWVLSCRREGDACAEKASQTIEYSGRFFTGTGRPVGMSSFDLFLPSHRQGRDLNQIRLRTDELGRFCVRTPIETVSVGAELRSATPAGPVDPRFGAAFLERRAAAYPHKPPPILVAPDSRAWFAGAETELYRPQDRTRSCVSVGRAPWWHYLYKSGDWRVTTPIATSLFAIFLVLAGLAGSRRMGTNLVGLVGVGAAVTSAILVKLVG
jgi:hypothetical protein